MGVELGAQRRKQGSNEPDTVKSKTQKPTVTSCLVLET